MMTTKHEIEVPGLPEEWKPVAYRVPSIGEWVMFGNGVVRQVIQRYNASGYKCVEDKRRLVVEKIKPKRIVLECTGEVRRPEVGEYAQYGDSFTLCRDQDRWGCEHEIWRKVKEDAK